MVVEVQQVENRIFWCGFGFHEFFCIGTVPRLFSTTNNVYNATENPFIICGGTVQAGNVCGDIMFYHKGLNMVVLVIFPCHFTSCMGIFFAYMNFHV